MRKLTCIVLISLLATTTYSQVQNAFNYYRPQSIAQTIGEKYVLLNAPDGSEDYGMYLHLWPNPTDEIPVPSAEGGKAIVTLQSITPDSYARLTDDQGAIYYQYFEKGHDEELMFFVLLRDFDTAKALIGKKVLLKAENKKVSIKAISLTSDHNLPFLISYEYPDGKAGAVKTVLSGTNSKVTDKGVLFDSQFSLLGGK